MNVPKLRFKEFNDEWIETNLGQSTTFKQGIQVDVENQFSEPFDDSVRFIRIVDYTQNTKDKRYIVKPKNANFVDEHDVVLVRYGATAGFVGHGITGAIANNMFTVTPNKNIDKDFLYTILKQEKIYKKLNSSNGSSAMPALNFGSVSLLKFKYPSILEQKKLYKFLSLLDKKIELQTKKIEDLKLFKKGLLNKLVDDIVPEQKCKLSDLGNSYSGISGKTKEDFNCGDAKYIPFMNVLKNNIDILNLPSINICSGEKQNEVKNGDLFFTISSETKEEVGMCATLKNNVENVYLNSFCFGFRIKDNNMMNNEFLCYLLLSKKYRKIISNLGQGFTRVNISKNQLLDIEVEIPSIDVQKKISKTIICLEKHIDLECNILYKLNELKKGLMQNMFV